MRAEELSPVKRDAAARRAAQTVFDRPLAVEAGAGTGKTATLVARIVAWCLGPGWEEAATPDAEPDEIAGRVLDGVVAITFTEDAAAEMAERVAAAFRALESWDGGGETPGNLPGLLREVLPEGADMVRERSRVLLVQIERLRVSTIHAFASSLLARFPVEAGVHPAFTVDADGTMVQEIVEQTAAEVLAAAYASRGGDALAVAEKGLGPSEIAEAVLELVLSGVSAKILAEDPFTEQRIAELLGELEEILQGCAEDLQKLKNVTGADADVRAAKFLLALLDIVRSAKGPPRQTIIDVTEKIKVEFGSNKTKLAKWSKESPEFTQKALAVLEDPDGLHDATRRLKPLLDVFRQLDPDTFNAVRRVLLEILSRVEREKRRRGVLVFQDLLVHARELLENESNRPILVRVQSEIRQLLVDEMQDTDPEQARIVELLALGGGPGPRPGLFLVGDPKQSIYGWRSADIAVYQELVRHIVAEGGERHVLVVNFRSVPAILDEVRRVVEPNMTPNPGVQPPFEPLEPCEKNRDAEGFSSDEPRRQPVEHWAIAKPADDGVSLPAGTTSAKEAARIEAEAIALDIASLGAQGVPFSGMAVLMRSRSTLQVFLEELRRHGIPYEVGRDQSFFRTREVVEAAALIRLVLDPHDPLALAAVLRSPLVGIPDAALAPLWRAGLPGLVAELDGEEEELPPAIVGAVADAARVVEALDLHELPGFEELAHWSGALLAFLSILGTLRRSWHEDPPDRFLENLRRETLVEPLAAARFPGHHRLANVDRFLRSLEEQLLAGATAGELLRWLRRVARERPDESSGRPREDVRNAVRVLTIHGAKGLEFDHVWLVRTHGQRRKSDGKKTDAGRAHGGSGERWELSLAGHVTPGYHQLRERREKVAKAEEVRLLYVALTRAKERLVTSGCWNPKNGTGPFLEALRQRTGDEGPAWFTFGELWREVLDEADGRLERHDALWSLPALEAWKAGLTGGTKAASEPVAAAERVADDERALETLRRHSAARQGRPWLGAVSAEAHRELAEAVAAAVEGAETPEEEAAPRHAAVDRSVATAAGTAVHRVLERIDPGAADPATELDRLRAEAHAWLETAVPTADLAEARQRLDTLLETFRSGPLWERFLALHGHILARELPVLLPPSADPTADDDPVGAYQGVIDLLYRDPATGELVVADYKTDAKEHMAERAGFYRSQLALYARAIQEALALPEPPRTELWFLAAGEIRAIS